MTDQLRDQLQTSLGSAYTIGRELGGGGMSRVFVAEDTTLGRPVVVKVLAPELTAGVNVDRFKREIRMAARLQHPHIVPVLHSGEISGLPYFSMPFVEGQSLRSRLAQGALPINEVVSILRDVAKALEYAHARDVVHRDIKPDNVLLAGNAAVVTDFGIAKALSASKTLAPGATLTQAGTSLGTPAYMAPEQAAADPTTDHRADIYSFGVLGYELLAGHPPFAGRTPQKLLAAQMSERPVPINEIRGDVPAALAELVMRCLEKSADDRPQNAAALVRSLDTVTTGDARPVPALLLGGRAALRRALLIYAVAFVIVVLLARVATAEIGLPDWVFPGAIAVMLLGLPVVLFTAYVQRTVQHALTATPTFTPGGTPAPASTMATIALKASPHVSWRRTATGGFVAVGTLVLLIVSYMTLRAMGIGPAGSLLGAGKIHVQDRVIVTDFHSAAADTSLAAVASEAVRTDLGESNVIALVTPAEVARALRLMQRPTTTRVDVPIAQEVAAREGAKAIVDGSITELGSGYLLTLRLLSAAGSELAAFHEAADGPHDLLPALDRLARHLRGKIGESLKSVQSDPPLEQVTTSSLDALRKYAEGVRANDIEGNQELAIAKLREAVALDTEFAMAYRKLGVSLNNARMPTESVDSALVRAFKYRDRLTERERQLATATYYEMGPGRDREKGAEAYKAMLAMDSLDYVALNNLATIYMNRRQYAAAETLLRRDVSRGTSGAVDYGNLWRSEFAAGQLGEAARDAALMKERFPSALNSVLADVPFLIHRNEVDSLQSLLERVRKSPVLEHQVSGEYLLAVLAIVRGQPQAWATNLADARLSDVRRGARIPPLDDSVTAAWLDIVLRAKPAQGVARLDAMLSRKPLGSMALLDDRPYFEIATSYALGGRPDRAKAILSQYASEVKDPARLRQWQPALHDVQGEIALAERRSKDALTEFARGDTAADGYPVPCAICLALNSGRAYDQAGNVDSALAMYERFEATPAVGRLGGGVVSYTPYRAAVYKRLGELYEGRGDRTRAATNYRQFIALWKDAEPELQPVVADARHRLANLGSEPTHEVRQGQAIH